MDSRSSTKDLSSSHSPESEDSELEESRDAFGNVEPYMSHLRTTRQNQVKATTRRIPTLRKDPTTPTG